MSLITRCPACATLFKVVPDQLRISAGWVRCGHCNEVFDAAAHMLPADQHAVALRAPMPPTSPPPAASAVTADAATPAEHRFQPDPRVAPSAPVPVEIGPSAPALGLMTNPVSWQTLAPPPTPGSKASITAASAPAGILSSAPPQDVPEPEPEAGSARGAPSTGVDLPTGGAFAAPATDAPGSTAATEAEVLPQEDAAPAHDAVVEELAQAGPPVQSATSEAMPPVAAVEAEAHASPVAGGDAASTTSGVDFVLSGVGAEAGPLSENAVAGDVALSPVPATPSFVAQARRRAFWASRPMQFVLWLLALLLLLALGLQMLIDRRDWLAAREPRLAPVLQSLCTPLGCQVSPYRLLDAIVIDSSAFNRTDDDAFRFSVVLRNTADMPVATPALELSLTDVQDQPLVRRVVTAAELGAPAALAPRGEFSGARQLTVTDIANPSAITGYRLMAFYP